MKVERGKRDFLLQFTPCFLSPFNYHYELPFTNHCLLTAVHSSPDDCS